MQRSALLVGALLFALGLWAFNLQARQTRDTTRKLDLEDIETALRRSLAVTGTLPPSETPTWCGNLSAAEHSAVRADIERFLRETAKYAKAEKPFPHDPRFAGSPKEYLYVKMSPVSFGLFATLEAERTQRWNPPACGTKGAYDYAVLSLLRSPL